MTTAVAASIAPTYVPPKTGITDKKGRTQSTGDRKNAVAQVIMERGAGLIVVNGRPLEKYFGRAVLRMLVNQPFVAANRLNQYNVICRVHGGGLSGQAGAIRHALSRALVHAEPELRSVLKSGGFLTRDPRVVERKKYGRSGARRRFQFSKR